MVGILRKHYNKQCLHGATTSEGGCEKNEVCEEE